MSRLISGESTYRCELRNSRALELAPSSSESSQQRRLVVAMLVLFVVAFAVRFALVLAFPNFDLPIRGEMERVAVSWATTGQLANPYATPTGPTAHVAPLYPIVLGSIYRLFGLGANGHLVQAAFSCTCSAMRSSFLLLLAVLLGLGFRTGWVAGLLSVGYIAAFSTELRGAWEAPLAGLFLMVFVVLAANFYRAPTFGLRGALAYGALAGTGVLLSPTLAPPMAAFVACTIPLGLRQWKRYAVWLATLAVVAVLVVLPWLIRNQRLLGKPVIRSNFGLELSLAYNDSGSASALDPSITASHPLQNPVVSQEVARKGELAFNRAREKQARAWIRQHPAAALRLFGKHFIYFWFPPSLHPAMRVALYGITISSLLGFILLLSQNRLAASVIGLIWLTFPLIYYVTYWSSRYRYPMEWTLLLCSAVLFQTGWRRIRQLKAGAHRSTSFPLSFRAQLGIRILLTTDD